MHRAFFITLGRRLDPIGAAIAHEFEVRKRYGVLPEDTEAEFLEAPIEGVGNLSRPVELLKDKLWEDIIDRLTRLLTFQNDADAFHLDIVLLTNFGESLAVGATRVIVDALLDVVPKEFATIFPKHQQGHQRRWRILPIGVVPGRRDSERERNDCIMDAAAFHDHVESQREANADDSDFPIERLFLMDTMTPRGVITFDEVCIQSREFCRFLLFSGLRTTVPMTQLLEAEVNEIGGTFSVAGASLALDKLHLRLTERLCAATANVLDTRHTEECPSLAGLLSAEAVVDERACDAACETIATFGVNALEADGLPVMNAVISRYRDLPKWIQAAGEEAKWNRDSSENGSKPKRSSHAGAIGASTAALSGVLFLAAHYAVGWTIVASAGLAAGFGVAALAILGAMLFMTNRRGTNDKKKSSTNQDQQDPIDVLVDRLLLEADAWTRKLIDVETEVKKTAVALGTREVNAEEDLEASAFHANLLTNEIADALYAKKAHDPAVFVDQFVDACGGWSGLLESPASMNDASMQDSAWKRFDLDRGQFEVGDVRKSLEDALAQAVVQFQNGIEPTLEHKSREQFDPTGINDVLANQIIAGDLKLPDELGRLNRTPHPCFPIDAWVISAVIDIHRDAITIFNLE